MPPGQVGGCEASPGKGNGNTVQIPPETPDHNGGVQFPFRLLPSGIDYDVFNQLPREIKEEIISSQTGERNTVTNVLRQPFFASRKECLDKAREQTSHGPLHSGSAHQNICSLVPPDTLSLSGVSPSAELRSAPMCLGPQHRSLEVTVNAPANKIISTAFKSSAPAQPPFRQASIPKLQEETDEGKPRDGDHRGGSKCILPSSVDAKTFSELPTEIQKELLLEWESRGPVSKLRVVVSPSKLQTKKTGGRPSPRQSNSLLRYFKPA